MAPPIDAPSYPSARTWVMVGAVALVAFAAVGAAGLALSGHNQGPAAADPTATAATGATTGATSAPATEPAASSTPATLGPWTTAAAPTLPGHAFFLLSSSGASTLADLGGGQFRTGELTGDAQFCVGNTITVSPDGRRAAYVRDARIPGGYVPGDLVVVDLDTRHETVIPGPGWCAAPYPVFSADSRSIVFSRSTDNGQRRVTPAVRYRLDTGSTSTVSERDASTVYAVGGAFSAYPDGATIVVRNAAGGVIRRCAYPTGGSGKLDLVGQSPDGRYVSVGSHTSDGSHERFVRLIVDTVTCREKTVFPGQEIASIAFAADGGLVVQMGEPGSSTYHLKLLKPDGTLAADVVVPSGPRTIPFPLGYVG